MSKVKDKPKLRGRNGKGQFKAKNKAATGRRDKPQDIRSKKLKEAYIEAVTKEDIEHIVKALIIKARNGDVQAAKEVFDRLWGRAKQELDIEHSVSEETATILGLIDGSSKGKLPSEGEKDV